MAERHRPDLQRAVWPWGHAADIRLEQFVARELVALVLAPLGSRRHMLGRFTADALNPGQVLDIAANSRAVDLRQAILDFADPAQDGRPVEQFIDDAIIAEPAHGVTVEFSVEREPRSFSSMTTVILGRASIGLAGRNNHTHARRGAQSRRVGQRDSG